MQVELKKNLSIEKASTPNLMNALTKGNKFEINLALKQFKQPNGVIYFPALFEIKSEHRLPELAKKDYSAALQIVTAGLTLAFETMNLARSLNADQFIDLAETVLESSNEDNLSLEDLMLFLQKLTRGEYGKLYESMDIPKFMELFEQYREQRFQALKELRYEQSVQHKALPINERIVEISNEIERDKHREAMKDYLKKTI